MSEVVGGPEARPWWHHTFLICVLMVVGVVGLGLGDIMPRVLASNASRRGPYPLPAHHAVFIYTWTSETECSITEGGRETFHIRIARAEPIPFTGYRLAPWPTAGATLSCEGGAQVTVDPDWRYDLSNNQTAKVSLTVVGFPALVLGVWIAVQRRSRSSRPGPLRRA